MRVTHDDGPVVSRVRNLVAPIASDLGLDLYDVEQRGDTLRVTLDTPPGSTSGVDLDTLALATRLVSRDLDHDDPLPGHYTLEVTSPGVERSLRTPAHFQRELGKTLNVRLADVGNDQRRHRGGARRRRRLLGDAPGRRSGHGWDGRTGRRLRPDRPRQDGVRVGPQAEAGRVEAPRHDHRGRTSEPARARSQTKSQPERASREKQSS